MATYGVPPSAQRFVPNQMSYGNDVFSDFDNLNTGHPSHSSNVQGPWFMTPPSAVQSGLSFQRQPSRSPQAASSAATLRGGTPIRHYQPSMARGRSHSRSEMLRAYTQQKQSFESQSLSSMAAAPLQSSLPMPQIYNMPTYNMSTPMTNFPPADDILPSSVPPPNAQQKVDILMQQQNVEDLQAVYPVGRNSPHNSEMPLRQRPPPGSHHLHYAAGQAEASQQALPSQGTTLQPFPPVALPLESSPPEIEIKPSRPKPRCWEHGCNGRQFSTFSNLLRHQREKSGSAIKAVCPHCGTEFTRTTARNGHMSGGKCKGKADAEASNRIVKDERAFDQTWP